VEAFRARSDEDALCMELSDEIEAECQQIGRPDMSEPGETGLPDG
jgi:hypothetical protein